MLIDHHLLAAITLAGMLLDVLGGLYLAYDLLGGSKGPLGTLTRWVTYALLFGVTYGLVLGPAFGLVAGPCLGLALALELGRGPGREPDRLLTQTLPFAAFRGLALGTSAAFAFNPRFGLIFGPLSALGLVGAYALGSSPTQDYREDRRPGFTRRRLRATSLRGLAVGLAGLVAGLAAGEGIAALLFAVAVAVVVGAVGGIVATAVPVVEAWAGRLPPRRLGTFGVVLLLLGVLLQSLQYWEVLLD